MYLAARKGAYIDRKATLMGVESTDCRCVVSLFEADMF